MVLVLPATVSGIQTIEEASLPLLLRWWRVRLRLTNVSIFQTGAFVYI